MTPEVEAALEWFTAAEPNWFNSTTLKHGNILAARVRELEGRTCETCASQRPAGTVFSVAICGKVSVPGHSVAVVSCTSIGNTCGAWARRDSATSVTKETK